MVGNKQDKQEERKKHCTSPHAWCKNENKKIKNKKKDPEISIHAHHLQNSEIMVGNLRSLVLGLPPNYKRGELKLWV